MTIGARQAASGAMRHELSFPVPGFESDAISKPFLEQAARQVAADEDHGAFAPVSRRPGLAGTSTHQHVHALEDHAARLAGDIENTLVAQHVHAVSLHQHGKKGLGLFHVERALVLPYKRLDSVVMFVMVPGEEFGCDV